jgi:hypothetical protein
MNRYILFSLIVFLILLFLFSLSGFFMAGSFSVSSLANKNRYQALITIYSLGMIISSAGIWLLVKKL